MSKPHPRSTFSPIEDALLTQYVKAYGTDWFTISYRMGNRSPRQCKERWDTYLRPDLNFNDWSAEEDSFLEECVEKAGHQWKALEKFFPGRTAVNIKNRYNVILRKNKREKRAAALKEKCESVDFPVIQLEPISIDSMPSKPIQEACEKNNTLNEFDIFDKFFDEMATFEEELLF